MFNGGFLLKSGISARKSLIFKDFGGFKFAKSCLSPTDTLGLEPVLK